MKPYLITLRNGQYKNNSAGVRVQHRLAHLLNENGCEAYVDCVGINKEWNYSTINDGNITEHFKDLINKDFICVYCDEFAPMGNFYNSKHPIGYDCGLSEYYGDFKFNGLIFGYLPIIKRQYTLFINSIDLKIFNKNNIGERKFNTIWVGKGDPKAINNFELDNVQIIDYKYPNTREGVADILKQSKVLYTTDSFTALSLEARLCGCPVVYVENNGGKFLKCTKELFINTNISRSGLAIGQKELDVAQKTINCFTEEYLNFIKREESDIEKFIKLTQE